MRKHSYLSGKYMGVTSSMACQSTATSVPRKMRRMQRRKDAVMTPMMSRQWWWSGGLTTLLFMCRVSPKLCVTYGFMCNINVHYERYAWLFHFYDVLRVPGANQLYLFVAYIALLLVKQQDPCQSRQIEAELLLPRRGKFSCLLSRPVGPVKQKCGEMLLDISPARHVCVAQISYWDL